MSTSDDIDMLENNSSIINVEARANQSIIQPGLDRFAIFNICINNAFEKISSGVSEEQYTSLFGTVPAFKKIKFVKVHSKIKTNLVKALLTEIETWVKEERIEHKLHKLDQLVEDCAFEDGTVAWRPNGNVNDHLRSHAMVVKMKHKNALEEIVRDKEQSTKTLQQQIIMLRSQVRRLESKLQHIQTQSLESSVVDNIDMKVTEFCFLKSQST